MGRRTDLRARGAEHGVILTDQRPRRVTLGHGAPRPAMELKTRESAWIDERTFSEHVRQQRCASRKSGGREGVHSLDPPRRDAMSRGGGLKSGRPITVRRAVDHMDGQHGSQFAPPLVKPPSTARQLASERLPATLRAARSAMPEAPSRAASAASTRDSATSRDASTISRW